MAFCIVNTSTVAVAPGGGSMNISEVGDRHRAFDGTYRNTVTDQLRVWKVRTAPITRATADALYTNLTLTSQPVACSGDFLGGAVNCYTKFDTWRSVIQDSTHRIVVEFTLEESS